MSTVFLFCALVGGTFLACQLVMTLLGLGHSGLDADLIHDVPDVSGMHVDDVAHPDGAGYGHDGHAHDGHSHDGHNHSSSWLFGIISFRTLVAATAMFGLAGMASSTAGLSLRLQVLIALISAGAAMFGVHWLVRTLYGLGQSGTLRLSNAIGAIATVSIPIPGSSSGQGKVRLTVQGRLEELAAVTPTADTLATGSSVVVTEIVSGNVLSVEPVRQPR